MPNNINYVTQFAPALIEQYREGLLTSDLTYTQPVTFVGAKSVRVPYLVTSGFKDYDRNNGFEGGSVSNEDQEFSLSHDRGVAFLVDAMDVDETNQAVSAANVTANFEREHAIPETDAYRIAKLFADYDLAAGGAVDTTALSVTNILQVFDDAMTAMDDAEVPQEGRILYVTPTVNGMLKNAATLSRTINVSTRADGIYRSVRSLDEVKIIVVPSRRMKTVYDFADGFVPGAGAKQVNMLLVHPKSVLAVNKHSFIRLWEPGSHTSGDGYLYQNRQYWDLFLIQNRADGVYFNVT